MTKKKRTARTRLSRGVFVSLCLVATIVLAVGTGIFSQRALEQQVLSDNSGTNLSESVAEVNIAEEEQPEPLEITSDAEYGDYEKGKVLVAVDETTDMQHLDEVLATSDLVETKSVSDQDISGGFVRVDINGDIPIKQILSELKGEGFAAQPNYIYYPAEDEVTSSAVSVNDPSSSKQWLLESVDAYRAWEIAKCKEDAASSPKVSVAVIDTGCLVAHEDLINNIRAVYNSATSELGVDKVADSIGHGTHVAGIVAADANNGKGVAGVSYDAGLVIIKASIGDTKSFSTETLAQAYTWLMTNSGAQTNAQRNNVRVINMSVGGKGSIDSDDVLYQKITQAKNAGILTVCAAGNADAGATPPFDCIPGDYKDCFTVINLAQGSNAQPNDSSGTSYVTRSNTSNYNVSSGELSQAKNISAPGAKIYSTYNGGTSSYGSLSGTSMASPAVAGIAALLFAYDPSLSADEVREVLEQTATDIGAEGWDRETGYGEIDAYHALQVLSAEIANDQVMGEQPVELEVQGADGIAADASEWQWESSDPNILAVDNTAGTATAIGSGTATLTATHKKLASRTLSKQVSVDAAGLEEKIDLSDSTAISASIDSGQAFAYTGQEARPSVTVKTKDGKTLKEGTDYTLEYANNISASVNTANKKARVVVAASSTSGIYTGSVELYFTIDQADIGSAAIDPIADQKYTGSAIAPTPVVKVNGSTLSAIDYTVSYKNNINVGTATLVVTGKGNYKGTKEATFKIAQDQGSTSTSSSTEGQSKVITVPATYTYNPTTHPQTLTATVTYDSNFNKGQKARFTYNISGNKRPLVYKLNSFEIETSSGWSPLVDITRGEYGSFNTKNYFEEALYTPGNYRLSFLVAEYTANADGTKTLGDMQRFQINFTVAESDNFKSIETIVAEVVAQCEQECANSKGTSSYDYDRALWLNDWLVENTKYDSSLMYCSAEGVFNRGLGTCEGYHEAYAMLLNKAGIETRRVDDFGDAHVWTGIKLNGNWYNVDTTWNDTGDYTRSDLDLQRLYFALPSGIIQKVHPKWDGQYSIKYPDRATFDANSFADNYFIHSGEIAQYVSPYTAESGSYSVKSKLASKVTSFDLPVEKSSWPDNYKNVIYSLVAYQLGTQNWGDGIKVNVGYSDGSLHFQATYDGSTPSVSLTDAVVMDLDNQTYSGSALTPKPTVVLGGKTLVEGTDYQLSYENNVNASVLDKTKPAAVIIQGKGAYSGSLKKTFTIDQAEVYYAAVAAISAQQYTGSALTPKPTITLGGRTLTTSDYSISYKNNTNVGTATVTITGKGNYKGTKETTFKINAKTLPSNPVLSVTSYTYDGKAKTPGVTVKDGTKTLVNNTDYTVRYSNNTNVGTATVTVTGKGNYTGSKSTTFRINAKTLPSNPVLSATSYIYDGKAKTPGVTVKDGTKTLVNGTDYTVKYSNNVNVGTATVTVTGKGNYTGSKSTNFKINAVSSSGGGSTTSPLSRATVTKFSTTRNITGKAISLPVSIKYDSKNLTSSDYSLTYNNSSSFPTKAGTYTVRAVGKGSYSGTIDVGTLKLIQGPKAGSVRISSLSNANYVLDATGATPKIGANVTIWSDNGGSNQEWNLVLGADGYYTIRSISNQGYFLDAANKTPSRGSNVSIWTNSNGTNQKWLIEPSDNNSYVIRNVSNQSLVLDASGATPKQGANVSVWTSNGGKNQKWRISTIVEPSFDKNKTYEITSLSNSGFVLDAAGSTPRIGANVSIWTKNGGKNQKWRFVPAGNGYYYIQSVSNPNYVLDAAGKSPKRGSNVSIWTNNKGNNQKWKIEQLANGSYVIRSAANQSYVLDAAGSSPKRGANVSVWTSNGGNNQKWNIKAV